MHDPLGMRCRQRVRHLHRDVHELLRVHRLPLGRLLANALLQALALQLLHHDEGLAFVIVDVVDRADIRMGQLRRRPRLARKALQRARVLHQVIGNKLERDEPPQAQVLRLIHHSHPPAAQFPKHAVMGHSLAHHVHAVNQAGTLTRRGTMLECPRKWVNRRLAIAADPRRRPRPPTSIASATHGQQLDPQKKPQGQSAGWRLGPAVLD